jgi:hypothetical protein
MAVGRAIGNLLGGVSQQPENSRFANMADESINTYASLTQGLDKRRPTEHLRLVASDSTVNGYFHAIKRSPTEQYGIWVYRNSSGNVFIKAFNLLDGTEVKIFPSADSGASEITVSDLSAYFSTLGELVDFSDGFQAMTVADNTFLLNRNRVARLSTSPEDKFEQEAATVQIAAGYTGTHYTITLDGMEFFYLTPQGTSNNANGSTYKTDHIAQRLVYGVYEHSEGPVHSGLVPNWSDADGNTIHSTDHPFTEAGRFDIGDGLKGRCYGLVQSQRCTHFIHTTESSRPGGGAAYTEVATDQEADSNKRVFKLYGDHSKWAGTTGSPDPTGTRFKLSVEYYDDSADEWKIEETDYIAFHSARTTTTIKDSVQAELRALTNVVCGTSNTGITVTVPTDRWWDYEIEVDYSATGDTPIRNIFVSEALYEPPVGETRYTARLEGSSIAIMKWIPTSTANGSYHGTAMSIKVVDGQGDNAVKLAYKTEVDFASLPVHGLDGQVVKVQGVNEEAADDYYVKFVANIDSESESARNEGTSYGQHFGKGIWKESAPNKEKETIDSDTMPHVLESRIGEQSGNPTGINEGDPYFVYKSFDFSGREVGDSETNKTPSFIGRKISGLTYHRGRLGIMANESLALSEAAGPANFYRTTVNILRDTDRIDITARSPKVSILRSAVEMQENLLLFSDQNQFILTTGGGPLSPASAGLDMVSNYEATSYVAPQVTGFSAYFPFSRGSYSGIERLYPAGGAANLFKGEEATAQVPNYIKGSVRSMAVSEMEKCLAVLTDDGQYLYIYKWEDVGDRRAQSAWFKHEFTPSSLGTRGNILGVQIIDSAVYILVVRNGVAPYKVCLERIDLEDGALDIADTETTDDVWYMTRLDRRLASESMSSISYSDPDTTVTIDSSTGVEYEGGTSVELVYRHGVSGQVGGYRVTGTVSGSAGTYSNVITFAGDHSGKKFYIGQPYTMRHTLSKPYIDGGQSGALITGRLQVRRAFVDVADTGYFASEVTPTGRSKSTDYNPSQGYGQSVTSDVEPLERSFTVPIFAQAGECVFDLVNDSPYPSRFVNLEYEATYNSRSRRIG